MNINFALFSKKHAIHLAWAQAAIATLGSLYFSEIKHFTPCTLCWYQRILMYPLVLIIAVGILRKDKKIYQYVLPLSTLGTLIALYHNLLQNKILPESVAPCTLGASCTVRYSGYFGFLTIPLMSLIAFTIITICMLIYKYANSKNQIPNSK